MEGAPFVRRWIAAPLIAAALTLSSAAEARQSPTALTINDPAGAVTVTEAQLDHWVEVARRSSGNPNDRTPKRQLQAQALRLLISFAWIEGEARVQGVTLAKEEVEASFDEQKRQSFPRDADFRKFLRTSGQSLQDILQRVRLDLLSNAIRDKVVASAVGSVTEADIDAYIAEHGLIDVPEHRELRILMTKTRAQAQAARAALERGASWRQVARRYSIDERSAGRPTWEAKGTLDRPLDRAAFRARKGHLTGPVKTPYGYYVFVVRRIRPATVMPEKEHRKLVRELLESQAQEELLTAFVKTFTATWKARTVCAPAYDWSQDCGNWDGTEIKP